MSKNLFDARIIRKILNTKKFYTNVFYEIGLNSKILRGILCCTHIIG